MSDQNCSGTSHPAFRLIDSTVVESLNLTVHHFEHQKTGAVHYHLESDHDEKAFLVALRTMPHDSTGVAHILEHTALCGSEKFPVRDPFFMMTRRSLNTFMNAMTSSDWTAYPFASQNLKDFNNLLDVYLDAVFFSRLDPLDFAQEGHRVEFSEEGNKASPLEYKGVVFNEMKGAMSSPVSQLWQGISSYLFPTTTYHYNSGGEPADITDLSYDELLAFYKTHYHPSNAIFMTFGDLDVSDLQQKIDGQALSRFERQEKQWRVAPEKRYPAPIAVEQAYGVDGDDLSAKTHHVMGWLLGDSTDLDAQLEANLLSQILLDNSASPLRRALEQTDLGGSPSPLCGLEDSNREMSFMCGIEGSEPEQAQALETLVLDTLQQVAEHGVERSMIDAALHQLELHQREIGGDHYPYGLQLIFNAIPAATHYGDPVSLLNLDPALERLKQKAAADNFVQDAVQRLLLNNRHRVRFTLKPDAQLNEEALRLEQQRLQDHLLSLNEADKDNIVEQTQALKERQAQQDDPGVLPQVTLDDVKPELSHVSPTAEHSANEQLPVSEYQTGTNGILYQQLLLDLPTLSREQLTWLPFFSHAWTEVGAGNNDYLAQQQKQTALVGSLSAYASIKGQVDDCNQLQSYLVMTGKALANNADAFSALNRETWQQARFDEDKRLLDLLTHATSRKQQGITGSGHALAMSLAASPISLAANVANELGGMPQALRLKQRLEQARQNPALIGEALAGLYQQLSDPQQALLVHDENHAPAHLSSVADQWTSVSASTAGAFKWQMPEQEAARYWMVDSQVNFCSLALPTVTLDHEDAAPLAVLGGILRNGFLHTAIREQGGAYGAGASQDSALGCFKFFSYRDPRVEGTFADFRQSIDWLLQQPANEDLVEQAVLGIIGSMDRPGSPAGEAKQAFHLDKTGRTRMIRQQFRERMLRVNWDDVVRVTEQYLKNQTGYSAVIAPKGTQAIAETLGLQTAEF
ncbi:insulinase family protein [Bacterioplanoides sp. SCSIO 12839]|uniref:insulinase family protein n=1 Tax=Bacterioplanoides sp. SCSIO 12839 TaxID=2829569 RepID=UPI0021040945|nr:insulinase family protein [Bacterioplanoides sp. SCSIO 12839]UTW49911.1 insulinase family protein [Bacterioplanoides sp. SCSIO 12839]